MTDPLPAAHRHLRALWRGIQRDPDLMRQVTGLLALLPALLLALDHDDGVSSPRVRVPGRPDDPGPARPGTMPPRG